MRTCVQEMRISRAAALILRGLSPPVSIAASLDAFRVASMSHNYSKIRFSSHASSTRWQQRQQTDKFSKDARLHGFRSRAAFKLLEMNRRYKIFKSGQTVVDLGYAPGSWSQVAVDKIQSNGQVIGIDILPTRPLPGVVAIQGDFLDPDVQRKVHRYVSHSSRGTVTSAEILEKLQLDDHVGYSGLADLTGVLAHSDTQRSVASSLERKSRISIEGSSAHEVDQSDRTVDVVLSDMMVNTSGNFSRDHLGSMDLCDAALRFAYNTLRPGGSFLCKFYQGTDEKLLENRLRILFSKVYREKPQSSRNTSREVYLVALRRKPCVALELLWPENSHDAPYR